MQSPNRTGTRTHQSPVLQNSAEPHSSHKDSAPRRDQAKRFPLQVNDNRTFLMFWMVRKAKSYDMFIYFHTHHQKHQTQGVTRLGKKEDMMSSLTAATLQASAGESGNGDPSHSIPTLENQKIPFSRKRLGAATQNLGPTPEICQVLGWSKIFSSSPGHFNQIQGAKSMPCLAISWIKYCCPWPDLTTTLGR